MLVKRVLVAVSIYLSLFLAYMPAGRLIAGVELLSVKYVPCRFRCNQLTAVIMDAHNAYLTFALLHCFNKMFPVRKEFSDDDVPIPTGVYRLSDAGMEKISNVSYPGAVSGITTSGIATTTTVARTITTVATAATWTTGTMVASSATALRPAVPFHQKHSNDPPRKVTGLCGPHINTNHTTDARGTVSVSKLITVVPSTFPASPAILPTGSSFAPVRRGATVALAVQRSATTTAAVQHSATVTPAVQRSAVLLVTFIDTKLPTLTLFEVSHSLFNLSFYSHVNNVV